MRNKIHTQGTSPLRSLPLTSSPKTRYLTIQKLEPTLPLACLRNGETLGWILCFAHVWIHEGALVVVLAVEDVVVVLVFVVIVVLDVLRGEEVMVVLVLVVVLVFLRVSESLSPSFSLCFETAAVKSRSGVHRLHQTG